MRLRDEEKKFEDVEEFRGMIQHDLLQDVAAKFIQEINTIEQLNQFQDKVRYAISRMIKVDRVVLVAEDHELKDQRRLKLHPNHQGEYS